MEPRGIIITPTLPNRIGPLKEPIFINESYLRFCLLYWDLLDCPEDRGGDSLLKIQPELKLLHEEGILKRTRGHFFFKKNENENIRLSFFAEHPREFWITAQMCAFFKYAQSGEHWTLGNRPSPTLNPEVWEYIFLKIPGDLVTWIEPLNNIENCFVHGPTVELSLHNSLPVPGPSVSLERILEFKVRRKEEFSQFRITIDELYLSITDSADLIVAKSIATRKLQQALIDIENVLKESKIKRFVTSFKAELSITEIIRRTLSAGVAGALVGSQFSLPRLGALLGGFSGAIASVIDLKIDLTALKPKNLPPHLRDFNYLFGIKKELSEPSKEPLNTQYIHWP